MSLPWQVWMGFIIGVGIGAAFFLLSFFTAFGICSDTTIAENLFPFAFIVSPSLFDHALIALALASIQYPIYGTVLGAAWTQARVRKFIFAASLLVVLIGHVVAVEVANKRVKAMWDYRFSHVK